MSKQDEDGWTLTETEDGWWEIVDDWGSLHGRYGSKEDALHAAAGDADDNYATAVGLREEADDTQEVADSLRFLIYRLDQVGDTK